MREALAPTEFSHWGTMLSETALNAAYSSPERMRRITNEQSQCTCKLQNEGYYPQRHTIDAWFLTSPVLSRPLRQTKMVCCLFVGKCSQFKGETKLRLAIADIYIYPSFFRLPGC
jgi:hypothetical protein